MNLIVSIAGKCKGRTISSEQLVFSPVKRVRIRIAKSVKQVWNGRSRFR